MNKEYPSKLLEDAVNAFAKLPGVGRKSALRMALHILRTEKETVDSFVEAIQTFKHEIGFCSCCHTISDTELCEICSNPRRDHETVCVVESVKEVMLIENTQQYRGVYHVLGGVVSPINGIGPSDLEIDSLVNRVEKGDIKEIVLALNPNMEGDTTGFYLFRKLAPYDVKVTTIARGISFGDDLEYADEVTLGRSILNRIDFKTN